jgi:hypothetical protein
MRNLDDQPRAVHFRGGLTAYQEASGLVTDLVDDLLACLTLREGDGLLDHLVALAATHRPTLCQPWPTSYGGEPVRTRRRDGPHLRLLEGGGGRD